MNDRLPESPLVSILICNYNYGQFLSAAIDSALNQTYPRTEVIVVDDGSTDDSREIIASYENRIIPILKDNGGHSSAVNAGFAASRGDVICLLDSDDLFLPEKVSRVLQAWKQSPRSCIVYHQLRMTDAHGRNIGKPWPRSVWSGEIRKRVERSGGWWPHPNTSGLSFLRSYMERLLPIPTNSRRLFPDTYLAGPAAFAGPVTGVPACLGIIRLHGQHPSDPSGVDHFQQASFSAGKGLSSSSDLSKRKVKQYAAEFDALQETLRAKLDCSASMSLQDVWPYRRHQWFAGNSVTLTQVIASIVKCPTLPIAMKWREVAKMVLDSRH
jgi:hypothetical protein